MTCEVANAGLLCPVIAAQRVMARGCTAILADTCTQSRLGSFLWWWDLLLGYRQDEGKWWKDYEAFRRNGWCGLPK